MLHSATPKHDDLERASKQFAQGDLLIKPVTVYVARPDITASSWARNYTFPPDSSRLVTGGIAPEPEPPFFVILDQTCDVHKTSIPFIHAAPVYNAAAVLNAGELRKIRSHSGFGYLYALTATKLELHLTDDQRKQQKVGVKPEECLWVADLRIQVPIDKGVLLGREVIFAFREPSDRFRFGEHLGDRRSRPAIPNAVQDYVAPILVEELNRQPDSLLGVEFRVICDSQVSPTWMDLVLLLPDQEVSSDEVRAVLSPALDRIQSESGIDCCIRSCGTAHELSAADYRDSVGFNPEDLSQK